MRAGMLGVSRRSGRLALALLAASLVACGGGQAATVAPTDPPPGDARLPRRIPLRLIRYVRCDDCGSTCRRTCDEGPTRAELERSVAAANETFEAAGVSFHVRAYDRVEAPSFALWDDDDEPLPWSTVGPELARAFPGASSDAFPAGEAKKKKGYWLDLAATAWAQPDEITVHVRSDGTRGVTNFPEYGRSLTLAVDAFGDRRGMVHLFAHELGHYLGLRHTFEHGGEDPRTRRRWPLAARWDLVYRPAADGSPPVFFQSFAEAARYPDSELRLIHERPDTGRDNCGPHDPEGRIKCSLRGLDGTIHGRRSGDRDLAGMSFTLEGGRFGLNVESYGDMRLPRRLCRSQIEMVHAYLSFESVIARESRAKWGRLPKGVTELRSHRPALGLPAGR
jgi:hypothetical protein